MFLRCAVVLLLWVIVASSSATVCVRVGREFADVSKMRVLLLWVKVASSSATVCV
jgi:hypothetical protein